MTNTSALSISAEENPRPDSKGKPSGTVLALSWIIAIAGMGVSLFPGLKGLAILGGLASVVFIAVLVWHLSRTGLPAADLPDLSPILFPRLGFRGMLWAIIVSLGLLFVIGMMVHPWVVMVIVFVLIAVWITLAWRRRLSVRLVVLGLAAGLIAGLATRYIGPGDLFLFNLVTTPLLFIAGGLLLDHTGLARFRLMEGQYVLGLRSFLFACVLALPPALLNLLGNVQASDTWVDRWWEPLYAIAPGIAEETAARLFLTTLCYALLRPTTNARPRRAIVAAVLIGAFALSLGHAGFNLPAIIIGTLLFLVPAGLLFVKRDMEHAVGYHFCIDFVRFLAALLQ